MNLCSNMFSFWKLDNSVCFFLCINQIWKLKSCLFSFVNLRIKNILSDVYSVIYNFLFSFSIYIYFCLFVWIISLIQFRLTNDLLHVDVFLIFSFAVLPLNFFFFVSNKAFTLILYGLIRINLKDNIKYFDIRKNIEVSFFFFVCI